MRVPLQKLQKKNPLYLHQGGEETMELASFIVLEKFCPKVLAISCFTIEEHYLAGRKFLKLSYL
jgi:hypothetical protein